MKKELMGWEECIGHLRNVSKDVDKAKSILKLCNVRLRIVLGVKLDSETASIIAEDYYEIIKELLTALLLLSGKKSDNHECLIAFFKKDYPQKEYEIATIYELKRIRNAIDYEGLFVDKSYVERNRLELKHIIEFLTREVEEKLKNT